MPIKTDVDADESNPPVIPVTVTAEDDGSGGPTDYYCDVFICWDPGFLNFEATHNQPPDLLLTRFGLAGWFQRHIPAHGKIPFTVKLSCKNPGQGTYVSGFACDHETGTAACHYTPVLCKGGS